MASSLAIISNCIIAVITTTIATNSTQLNSDNCSSVVGQSLAQ